MSCTWHSIPSSFADLPDERTCKVERDKRGYGTPHSRVEQPFLETWDHPPNGVIRPARALIRRNITSTPRRKNPDGNTPGAINKRVHATHLLVKGGDFRRPSSWRF
ncbi:hypothetical protein BX666DRAFT_1881325 [Dichotomocladium elegans]|nr:hypothetical protein BX666DRAFT_1881325 [Dichotomocladium elegans]